MPRKERKHRETGIYHVMLRGWANQRPVPLIYNEMKQKFNTGIYYQDNRQNGQPGGHIDVRYNGYYGHMYKEFKTNVGFY